MQRGAEPRHQGVVGFAARSASICPFLLQDALHIAFRTLDDSAITLREIRPDSITAIAGDCGPDGKATDRPVLRLEIQIGTIRDTTSAPVESPRLLPDDFPRVEKTCVQLIFRYVQIPKIVLTQPLVSTGRGLRAGLLLNSILGSTTPGSFISRVEGDPRDIHKDLPDHTVEAVG